MKIKSFLGILLSVSGILSGCNSTANEQKPVWIDKPESVYDNSLYLTAIGQASKRDRAANRALANLANIFSVTITDKSEFHAEASSQKTAEGTQDQLKEKLIRNIASYTHHELEGAEIKESWQSPDGEYYALAILDKQVMATRLKKIIHSSDSATLELLKYSSDTAPNFINSFHALIQARNEQLSREEANKQLTIVASTGVQAQTSSKEIELLSHNMLAQLKVSGKAESDSSLLALQAAISQLGIVYDGSSSLMLEAKLDLTEPMLKDDWYWLRGSYELNFIQENTVISRKRWPVKISAKDKGHLNSRLKDKLNSKIPAYLIELLSSPPAL